VSSRCIIIREITDSLDKEFDVIELLKVKRLDNSNAVLCCRGQAKDRIIAERVDSATRRVTCLRRTFAADTAPRWRSTTWTSAPTQCAAAEL